MIGVCTRCGRGFETTVEEAYTPGCLCRDCWLASRRPPTKEKEGGVKK